MTLVFGFEFERFPSIECDWNFRISQNVQNLGFWKNDGFFLKTCITTVNVKTFVIKWIARKQMSKLFKGAFVELSYLRRKFAFFERKMFERFPSVERDWNIRISRNVQNLGFRKICDFFQNLFDYCQCKRFCHIKESSQKDVKIFQGSVRRKFAFLSEKNFERFPSVECDWNIKISRNVQILCSWKMMFFSQNLYAYCQYKNFVI